MTAKLAATMVAPNNGGGEEEDVGALIYRESQLRKAEAATEIKKISTASTKLRTSTRIRSLSTNHHMKSLSRPQRKSPSKRKRESSLEIDQPRKAAKKRKRGKCSAYGCTNNAQKEGLCRRHGAKRNIYYCFVEGCTE